MICPKVRLSDVLTCSRDDRKQGHGNKISQKHLDFVLVDAGTFAFRLAAEPSDKSHDCPDRRERDAFVDAALRGAGIPVLRVRAAQSYALAKLTQEIAAALG